MAVSEGFTVQPQELCFQHAKKVMSDNFAAGLVNSVLNLQIKFLGEFKLQKKCNQSRSSKKNWGRVGGLDKVALGVVHSRYSLPNWQAVKLTFFAPWVGCFLINR